jgi:hypothetical protein
LRVIHWELSNVRLTHRWRRCATILRGCWCHKCYAGLRRQCLVLILKRRI